jgi:DNA-binding transcriptional regulator GbsR (MarR family)
MTELERYIEEVGLFYERFGLTKMAGRILGFLMASEKDLLTFEEMMEQLQASKGSISGNINFLLKNNLIEKVMITGDRRSYYRFVSTNLLDAIDAKMQDARAIKSIFQKANKMNRNTKSEKYRSIEELVDYYSFLEEELPKIKMRWSRKRKARR